MRCGGAGVGFPPGGGGGGGGGPGGGWEPRGGGGRGDAVRRVWARLPTGSRAAMGALSGTDLQTLLMDVAESRASTVRPADLMRRWREDRLVRPADADPRAIAELEARLWRLLPEGVAG